VTATSDAVWRDRTDRLIWGIAHAVALQVGAACLTSVRADLEELREEMKARDHA
jgi:hypothetical protein